MKFSILNVNALVLFCNDLHHISTLPIGIKYKSITTTKLSQTLRHLSFSKLYQGSLLRKIQLSYPFKLSPSIFVEGYLKWLILHMTYVFVIAVETFFYFDMERCFASVLHSYQCKFLIFFLVNFIFCDEV